MHLGLWLINQRSEDNKKQQRGGRGTRTPTGFRPAVFKTAAIPLGDSSVYNSALRTLNIQKNIKARNKVASC